MEPEKDGWSWVAVLVAVAAMFALLFSLATTIVSAWVPWVAGIVFVLAMGVVGVRSWSRAKLVVWTEEQVEAQRGRYRRLFLEMFWLSPIPVGYWVSKGLVESGILPQWVGIILLLLSFAAVFVLRYVIRSSRAWKDLS
jgi:hypothetical protein